jgi:hypothetical protein
MKKKKKKKTKKEVFTVDAFSGVLTSPSSIPYSESADAAAPNPMTFRVTEAILGDLIF